MLYLLSGTYRLIEEQKMKLIPKGSQVTLLDGLFTSVFDILTEANYVSLFDEKKYVIVKNADFYGSSSISETDAELLLQYFEHPNEKCVLLFMTEKKLDHRKKITKKMKECGHVLEIETPMGSRLYDLTRQLIQNTGFTIESQALEYLITNSLNNYDFIYNEVEKIKLYYVRPCKILLKDVKEICSRSIEENQFRFVDAVIQKNGKKCYSILDDLYTKKIDPISLLLLLAREYRLLLSVKLMDKKRQTREKIASSLKLQNWQLDKTYKESLNFSFEELKENLIDLGKLDRDIKSGEIDRYLALNLFLMKTFM